MTEKAKVAACIICDIARRELGGKDILIGVYSNYIEVPSFPVALPNFAVWVELQTEETNIDNLEISILDPDNKVIINAKGKLEISSKAHSVGIPMQFANMTFTKSGKYTIKIGLDGPMKKTKEFFVHTAEAKLKKLSKQKTASK